MLGGKYNKLFDKLRDALSTAESGPAPTAARTPVAKKAPGLPPASGTEFDKQFARVCSEQQSIIGGKVQMINLQPLRDRFGARWEHLRERAHAIAGNVLARRLGSGDLYTRYEDAYVVMFGDLTEPEAKLKCTLLAREIAQKLGGDASEIATLDMSSIATEVKWDPDFNGQSGVDLVALACKKAEEKAATADVPGAGARKDELVRFFETIEKQVSELGKADAAKDPAAQLRQLEGFSSLLKKAQADLAKIVDESGEEGSGRKEGDPEWIAISSRRVEELANWVSFKKADIETALKAPGGTAAKSSDEPDIRHSYRPVWQARKNIFSAYYAQMTMRIGDETVLNDTPFGQGDDNKAMIGSIDRLVLSKTSKDLQEMIKGGRRVVATVPVHYSTLAWPPAARPYFQLMREVPSEVRALIVLEILELPFDSWFSQAHPVLSAVSRVGRSMLLRININTTDFKDFVSLGAYGVGADLHETPGSETDMIGRIEKFAARAARSGLRSYLYGISSLSLATAAICSGFDYVAGDVIAGPVDNPGSVVMADKWSIYTRALKSEPAGA